jgi:hypothetical protein
MIQDHFAAASAGLVLVRDTKSSSTIRDERRHRGDVEADSTLPNAVKLEEARTSRRN